MNFGSWFGNSLLGAGLGREQGVCSVVLVQPFPQPWEGCTLCSCPAAAAEFAQLVVFRSKHDVFPW